MARGRVKGEKKVDKGADKKNSILLTACHIYSFRRVATDVIASVM